ncbi:MAG: RNA-binding S4 domain-containing protein [Clostridiales bacterium]|nr:RNA-binding S4 domain-containing protein [Clostridiales bacterium]
MRIDKYLKLSRLIKRRTVANQACDAEKIFVNGRAVKASYDVKIGDIIEINLGKNPLKVKVIEIKDHVLKDGANDLYEIV